MLDQTISSVIDINTYVVTLIPFNLEASRINTGGGVTVTIYSPTEFRLLFDKSNTMGMVLGFRNPGAADSITPFNYVVTNQDPYFDELSVDTSGNPM